MLLDILRDTIKYANEHINYTTQKEFSIIPPGELGKGDCRTFAASIAQRLVDKGISPDSIWIAEAAVPPSEEVNHRFVMVEDSIGGDYSSYWILTNGYKYPLLIESCVGIGWTKWRRRKHGSEEGIMEDFIVTVG